MNFGGRIQFVVNSVRKVSFGSLALLIMTAAAYGAEKPFTIVALPDTQNYAQYFPKNYVAQTQWIKDHAKQSNIVLVTHLGDVVNESNSEEQYANAKKAMDLLDGPKPEGLVAYSVTLGNHDINHGADIFKKQYGPDHFAGYSWYKGAAPDGLSSYQIITVGEGGRKILHLNIKYQPTDTDTLKWAKEVLTQNAKIPTILSTHDYMLTDGKRSANGEVIWKELVAPYNHVFMVLAGHSFGENQRIDDNLAGHKVAQVLSDYQEEKDGGNGYLRIMRFDAAEGVINVRTYSPTLEEYRSKKEGQFDYKATFSGDEIRVKEYVPATFLVGPAKTEATGK